MVGHPRLHGAGAAARRGPPTRARTSGRSAWCCTRCSAGRRPFVAQTELRAQPRRSSTSTPPPLPADGTARAPGGGRSAASPRRRAQRFQRAERGAGRPRDGRVRRRDPLVLRAGPRPSPVGPCHRWSDAAGLARRARSPCSWRSTSAACGSRLLRSGPGQRAGYPHGGAALCQPLGRPGAGVPLGWADAGDDRAARAAAPGDIERDRADLGDALQEDRDSDRPDRARAGGAVRARGQRAARGRRGSGSPPSSSRCKDQAQLWADSYERELSGILALQSDVARKVASALALKLLPAGADRLASTPVPSTPKRMTRT